MNHLFKITFFNKSRRTSSGEKERFSLRKYKSGMVSVLIGILFLTGIGSVAAEEQGVSSAHVSAGNNIKKSAYCFSQAQ
ncbi:YSIRK-type signal peptide-containing protein [Streptococcus equi subsp. zooepidemicus]|nr:YSIRK-type signal peptide-containing protein [Streptococcus equi subsp. zooepidemicus]